MNWLINIFTSLFDKQKISLTVFLLVIVIAIILTTFKPKKKNSMLTPGRILFVGTFASTAMYLFPLYKIDGLGNMQAFLTALQHSFRIFALDGDYITFIADRTNWGNMAAIKSFYITYGSVLYLAAPIMTFGFILTFFKNFLSHLKYTFCFWATKHVFSELNEKSLALAKSLISNDWFLKRILPKNLIVFTDIIDKKEELSLDLIEEAKEIGAVLFRKDLESVRFRRSWTGRKVNFYLISEDEKEKIRHAESIIKNYDFDENVALRVFSDDLRTGLLIDAKKTNHMTIERINDIQMLIYHELYENGIHLFESARKIDNKDNLISAVIVGFGKYGQEMLKALTWYCQLTDYRLKINAFDEDKKAEEKFRALCPELMDPLYNKQFKDGEACYDITIHPGVDVSVPDFENQLKEINDATFIFVCLGNDETNLQTAIQIRSICERITYIADGVKPVIETVIYDSNVKNRMGISWEDLYGLRKLEKAGIKNYKNQPYNILMIGDLDNFYSKETLINSELEAAGLFIHTTYSTEGDKLRFTERLMEKEWMEFLKSENGLTEAWEAHLEARSLKIENEDKENSKKQLDARKESEDRANFKMEADKKWQAFYKEQEKSGIIKKSGNILFTLFKKIIPSEKNVTEKIKNSQAGTIPSTSSPANEINCEFRNEKKDNKTKAEYLSDKKDGFSFLTLAEQHSLLESDGEKKPKNSKAAERIYRWEQIVYKKFNQYMQNKNGQKSEFAKEWEAKKTSIKNDAKKSFRIEYNHRSSITKAIHRRLRLDPRVPGNLGDKPWKNLTLEEMVEIGKIEHVRWNAYMRTEGYSYSPNRNDLAKQHHNLVPVTLLSNDDLRKDA